MSVCASGASTTRPGVPAGVIIDQQYMQSLLPASIAWLYPYLPYSKTLVIGDVASFCSADPPTFSVPTAAEILNFLTGGSLNDYLTVAGFIDKLIKAYLWSKICMCTSGTTPSPTAPTPPAGLPAINPSDAVTGPLPTPCYTISVPEMTITTTSYAQYFGPVQGPSGVTGVVLRGQASSGSGTPAQNLLDLRQSATSAGTYADLAIIGEVVGQETTSAMAAAGSANFYKIFGKQTGGGTLVSTADIDFYCNGQDPTIPVGCTNCPPDPQMVGLIQQILQLTTLIQRQAVPFGYVSGAVHTGLSGAGALSISGLLGVKVAITTLPTSYGVLGTSPPEHFDLGFITFGTADGFPSAHRLTRNPHVLMPPRCSVYTDLDYDLSPGVVVTITELVREP
jgi:hypothetical protein